MHTHHINTRTSTRTQNVVTLPASAEFQLELFSAPSAPVATQNTAPVRTIERDPQQWPSNIMLHHPEDGSLSWTGRGRAPLWAAKWAAENNVDGYAIEIRAALLAAQEVSHA